jgi:hypothetical protein
MRNYAVLNISVEEARIFQTKERAPLLLCIEVYRPIEMTLDQPAEIYEQQEFKDLQKESFSKVDVKNAHKSNSMFKNRKSTMKNADKDVFQPWSPDNLQRNRPKMSGRSNSFRDQDVSNLFGSLKMDLDEADMILKKRSKFNIMKKFKKKKNSAL